MIDKVGKYLGGWLLLGGAVLALGPAWGDLPGWTVPAGVAIIVVGFVSLFYYGIRDRSRHWVAGDWVPATGEVQSQPFVTGDDRELKLKLNCSPHGVYLTTVAIGRIGLYREFPKGTPVTAMVRSNDRRVVELETVGGESWDEIVSRTDVEI